MNKKQKTLSFSIGLKDLFFFLLFFVHIIDKIMFINYKHTLSTTTVRLSEGWLVKISEIEKFF